VITAHSYFGDYTMYHLGLPSGTRIRAQVENRTRHHDDAPTQGDTVWAHWLPTSQVVLTQ
jgi:putrescine transport system ATP-binding protein